MSTRSEVEQFFESTTPSPLVAEWKERIQSFVTFHHEQGRRVAIVTVGRNYFLGGKGTTTHGAFLVRWHHGTPGEKHGALLG